MAKKPTNYLHTANIVCATLGVTQFIDVNFLQIEEKIVYLYRKVKRGQNYSLFCNFAFETISRSIVNLGHDANGGYERAMREIGQVFPGVSKHYFLQKLVLIYFVQKMCEKYRKDSTRQEMLSDIKKWINDLDPKEKFFE